MATTIKLKNGSGAPLAGDLVAAEPAFDLTNKRLYTEDAGGTVIEVGTNPSTIDINAGTIDGTVIGGASAAAGTFTTFTSTGIDDNATSTAITIDSSQNVGIGTASPSSELHIHVTGASNGAQILFDSDYGTGYVGQENNASNNLIIGSSSAGVTFYAANAQKMILSSSGNVGIGTSSPASKLQVAGGSILLDNNTALNWKDSVGTARTGILWGTSNQLAFYSGTDNAEKMRIDSSGNTIAKPSGGEVTLGANGHITSKQSLDVATAGGRYIGASNRGTVGQIRIEQTTTSADGGYVGIDTCASGSTSPTERMRIDSSGRALIGTTVADQDAKLTVVGSGAGGSSPATISANTVATFRRTGGLSHSANVSILGGSTGFSVLNLGDRDDEDVGRVYYDHTNNAMLFDTNAAERMRIDSSGNLIVGNTSVDATSSVSLKNEGSIRSIYASGVGGDSLFGGISGVSNGYQIVADASNNQTYKWHNGGTPSMTLNSSGRLGIGTASPSASLHVSDANTTIRITDTISTADYTFQATTNDIRLYDYTAAAERMRIDSSGNLLVGKTTTALTTAGIALQPNGELLVTRDSGATAYFNREGTDGDVIVIRNDNVTVGSISISGSTTSYNPSSDARLKENIRDYDNALADVMKLKPRKYSWKANGAEDNGFIAQELLEIPEFANRVNPLGDGDDPMYGVDYMKFVAVLTGAIQEQQAMIETLKAEVAALKGA